MGTKQNPAQFDCYSNALPDEPMFILLARDPKAPMLVDEWAALRAQQVDDGERPQADMAMVDEARQCAAAMRAWREANDGKWRAAQGEDK